MPVAIEPLSRSDVLLTRRTSSTKLKAAPLVVACGDGLLRVPAFGEEDFKVGQQEGLPIVRPVDLNGIFQAEVTDYAGQYVKDADKPLIRILKERGIMFRSERYKHNYPFGWRTGDPIIYYAKDAWYIRTSSFRDRMTELNKTIKWVPEHIRDGRFGNWLENNVAATSQRHTR